MEQRPAGSAVQNLSESEMWHLRRVFGRMDDDASGEIDRGELHHALVDLGFQTSKEKIDAMFSAADCDNNGTVDFEEFVELVNSMRSERGGSARRLWMDAMAAVDDEKYHKLANAAEIDPLRRSKEDIGVLAEHVYSRISTLGVPCFTKTVARMLVKGLERQQLEFGQTVAEAGSAIKGCILLVRGAVTMVDPEAVQEYDANLQLFEDGMIEKLTAAKPQEQVCSHMPMRDSLV